MLTNHFDNCKEFTAGDNTLIRELMNPRIAKEAIGYSIAHATVPVGKTSSPHQLKSAEAYYILEGRGIMHIDNEKQAVIPGSIIHIPPGANQSIENTGEKELKFICVVVPAWKAEDEEIN